MGAGNSTFTPEQAREISQAMKAEYEACKTKGLSSVEEQQNILKKYEALTKQLSAAQPKVVVANSRRLSRGYSKDEHGLQPKSSRTRRRSFDNKPTQSPNKKTKDMQQSASTPSLEAKVLEEPPAQVDTWDSVNGQPSCLICSMVFTTPQKLETHTKYSSLHASNLKKMQQSSLDSLAEEQAPAKSEPSSQEPSSRCRVMYTGTKFFWKTQDNIDIHLYYHIDSKCIEVIAYEGKANTELPRLYLSEPAVLEAVGEDSIMERVKDIQKDAANKRFKEALPSTQILYEEEKRIAISSRILSHLQMFTSDTPPSPQFLSKKQIRYVIQTDSGITESGAGAGGGGGATSGGPRVDEIVFTTKPDNVIPVYIARRRHTSEEEIKETLTDINSMQMDIRTMTQKAEKMANLVTKASQNLSSGIKKRKWRRANLSPWKIKWLWAIDFIIRRNRVAITRGILEKYQGKY